MRTFISNSVYSTHGTSKSASAVSARRNANNYPGVVYSVVHAGPRVFNVTATSVVESEAAPVNRIMDGSPIVCSCGSADWFYTGRSLYSLNYTCASCDRTISPVSETGACQ